MTLLWLRGLVARRGPRLLAAAVATATAVALIAALGAFLASSKATMTRQAVAGVATDQQVLVTPGNDPTAVAASVAAEPGTRAAVPVGYARSDGLSATTGGSTQTTGAATVLGLPDGYATLFPGAVRPLAGPTLADGAAPALPADGALVAQQTASNLHAAPGDTVLLTRTGLPPIPVRVTGVVDLPQANSLFQTVGAPAGAQPTAPPDNVVLLPATAWHAAFDELAGSRPDLVATQVHVQRDRVLPADPAAAYTTESSAAHHLSAQLVGRGTVSDNLAAALDGARQDSLYAQLLFLFLGSPGVVLAGLVTAAVAGVGADRRRAEQALLRARGATEPLLLRLAAVEALLVGVTGAVLGLGVGALVGWGAFGSASFGATAGTALAIGGLAAFVGLAIALATVLLPARRDLRQSRVLGGVPAARRDRRPLWWRIGLDVWLLVGAAAVYSVTSAAGYSLVLAPEGVASISVNYWAFTGPALLWTGCGLLAWRLADLLLRRGGPLLTRAFRPLAGALAGTIATTLGRQRGVVTRTAVLLGVALAFAVSTATFNATYATQAEADARLTNGADVTVTLGTATTLPPTSVAQLAAIPGVRHLDVLQHRYAYIGTDLQDLYGVDPATIGRSAGLQDSYVSGGTVSQLMAQLGATPDAVLVSAETVKDYQLRPGDPLTLRLRDGTTQTLKDVRFRYAGIIKEFPTAPKDSFFVANQAYVRQQTGNAAVGAYLLDTGRGDVGPVAARARDLVGSTARVSDIATTRTAVGSSLTAVDLAGLTRVELGFAAAFAAAGGGLLLALGLAERRRTFAIAAALGATRRQLAGFVWGEAAVVLACGVVTGGVLGTLLSLMLVKVLTGVFDPPPAALTVPGAYLALTGVLALAALLLAALATVRLSHRPPLSALRDL